MTKKAKVFNSQGIVSGEVELPWFFDVAVREDLIRRAVLSDLSSKYQPKGVYSEAGFQTSARYRGRKEWYGAIKNRGISRLPREILPNGRFGRVRRVPFAKGGHRAHPPKIEKKLYERMNKKEYLLALQCALSACADAKYALARGHKLTTGLTLPIVLDSSISSISKTADVVKLFEKLGLSEDLERSKSGKKRKTGVQRRVNKKKYPKSALVLFDSNCPAIRAFSNLPGVDVVDVDSLKVHDVAPGTHPGRLLLLTQESLQKLEQRFAKSK